LELNNGKLITDEKLSFTIATPKVYLEEPKDHEEGDHLFHSHMWVKGTTLHFIVDSDNQKKPISIEVIKSFNLTLI
jgi:hypothetical protein